MIYENIQSECAELLVPIQKRLAEISTLIEEKRKAKKTEDSKIREAEFEKEIKSLIKEQRKLWSEQTQVEEETFKNLLIEEYAIPKDHPKFEMLYSKSYNMGHSSGWSEIEGYFSDLVDLVK